MFELIIGEILETIPLTVVVRLLPEVVVELVVNPVRSGRRSKFTPVTPLTVVVRFEPVNTLLTVVPVLIADCRFCVVETPLTVEMMLVSESESEFVVPALIKG